MNLPRLLVTRPVEESARTVAAAEQAGFATLVAPLQRIVPVVWEPPAVAPEALLFTSARAPGLAGGFFREVPAFAVGAHSAAAARTAGYRVEGQGAADGSAALRLAAANGARRVLHLGGVERAELSLPPGVELEHRAVYAAEALPGLPEAVIAQLGAGDLFATLLFSPRAARLFSGHVDAAGVPRGALRVVALSAAVHDAAGTGWRASVAAPAPRLDALLAAARSLWQGEPHG